MAGVLCRDCLHRSGEGARRCAACGSPRLASHPELHELTVAHVDCDAFFAAVEKRDDLSLVNKPVIIGGGRRGVVSTACYNARLYGVRSAMPMFKALKACPQAVVIKPDIAKYAAVGRQVRAMMEAMTPLVEPVSIDEAFLDLAGTQALHHASPAETLLRFAQKVEREIGISVSIGLSYCKFLAKIASDLDKPRGFAAIGRAEAVAFLADKPVGLIHGVGEATRVRLEQAGFRRIGDIAAVPPERLMALAGRDGMRLASLARGIDPRPVRIERETKSVSAETTFDTDIRHRETLEPILWKLCEKVALRLRRADLATTSVTLKLKRADFQIRTRSRSGLPPTQLAARLYEAASEMLRLELDGTAFRLIGVGTSSFAPVEEADRGDLADVVTPRLARTERAIDSLRDRFGSDAVQRGLAFRPRPKPDRPG